ncbi:MAG: hypothetical protein ABIP64_11975 [Burkholderiales bacterium]
MRLISHARFVAYLLLLCLTGYAAAQDKVVPIDQEPRHKLVFSNDLLRIFDTRIPAGDVSLYHTHLADSVFVCIDSAETQSEEPGKEITKRPPFKAGEVWYRAHTKTPLTHRVTNLGKTDLRVLDIETLKAPTDPDLVMTALPPMFVPVLENDRVRVTRLKLIKGEKTLERVLTRPALMVIVKASKAVIDLPRSRTLTDYDTGDYFEIPAGKKYFVGNFGENEFEAIQIEIK